MKTVCKKNKCNGCMACISACPKQCITIKDNISDFNAEIDESTCVNCHLCETICPNVSKPLLNKPFDWKQGWTEQNIRSHSSSGGVASAIIREFILSGGYVASCLLKNGEFVFEITNETETAKKFAGSKYVKSNPVGIYEKIKQRLKTDKVLFIGLPCQVAALKNYIKNQENLYTADLICHGTPSAKLLEKFLTEHNVDLSKDENIKFRNGTTYGIIINNKIIDYSGMDYYSMNFLESVDLTENCYSCQFAQFERIGDITLGDSWGTEYKDEEKNGVSLILIQTNKGKSLIDSANLELKNVNIETAINANHQLKEPFAIKPVRKKFLQLIKEGKNFSYATFIIYKKRVIKRFIKKILIKLGIWKHLKKSC